METIGTLKHCTIHFSHLNFCNLPIAELAHLFFNLSLHILIISILVWGHIKFASMNIAQANITGADHKIALFETHGHRAITATPALMENKFTM